MVKKRYVPVYEGKVKSVNIRACTRHKVEVKSAGRRSFDRPENQCAIRLISGWNRARIWANTVSVGSTPTHLSTIMRF